MTKCADCGVDPECINCDKSIFDGYDLDGCCTACAGDMYTIREANRRLLSIVTTLILQRNRARQQRDEARTELDEAETRLDNYEKRFGQ